MALRPEYSSLSFIQAASGISATLFCDDISSQYELVDFERKEFSNAFLQNLPNSDGTLPIFQKNIQGKDVQVQFIGCGTNSTRNTLPDDANVAAILQRFTLRTYNIKGADSSPSDVNAIYNLSRDHKRRADVFKAYLKEFELKLSYQYFIALQTQMFTYLTQSGLSVTGLDISESNVLIEDFNEGYRFWTPGSNVVVVKDFSCKLQVYTALDSQIVF
jgi:hypothetical protein